MLLYLWSLYLLVQVLCWFPVPTSTSLCLGVWFYVKNMEQRIIPMIHTNGMLLYYLVHTSWHMLCTGVPYRLALVCAWVYDSKWTTWSTELPWWNVFMLLSLYLLVHVLYWCTVPTSTSLCLAVWFYVNNMEARVTLRECVYIILVYTSWHMICAGVLYQLALACAWVYDSKWTTWSTELP